MKRFIIFSLCQLLVFISPVSSLLAQEPPAESTRVKKTFADGMKDGRTFASTQYSAGKWFGYGFAGGLLLVGPIGTGIVAGVSQVGSAQVPPLDQLRIRTESAPYRDGYQRGYAQRVKTKALTNSLIGGAVGTAVLGLAVAVTVAAFQKAMHSDYTFD
jgi:hypothetical protein